jgi:hypothetical protein
MSVFIEITFQETVTLNLINICKSYIHKFSISYTFVHSKLNTFIVCTKRRGLKSSTLNLLNSHNQIISNK